MNPVDLKIKRALTLVIGGIFAAGFVMAAQPSWADPGKDRKNEHMDRRDEQRGERHDRDSRSGEKHRHFDDRRHAMVREYYEKEFHRGHCPYGLAKKHNGCMPRGQERKWRIGQQLPREVIFYDLPQPLVVELGRPPSGYRYVRVASDILMITIGTGMVIDAIEDLGR
jgi:Ni/Co efflux regulator RcnB